MLCRTLQFGILVRGRAVNEKGEQAQCKSCNWCRALADPKPEAEADGKKSGKKKESICASGSRSKRAGRGGIDGWVSRKRLSQNDLSFHRKLRSFHPVWRLVSRKSTGIVRRVREQSANKIAGVYCPCVHFS